MKGDEGMRVCAIVILCISSPAGIHEFVIFLLSFTFVLATQVKANGLIVFVPKYGIEGPVYLTPPPPGGRDGNKGGPAAGGKKKGNNKVGSASSAAAAAVEEEAFVLDEEAQAVTSRCEI